MIKQDVIGLIITENKADKGKSQKTEKKGPKQKYQKVASPDDDTEGLLLQDPGSFCEIDEEEISEESEEEEEDLSVGEGSSYHKKISFLAVLNQNAESRVRAQS